VNKTELHAIFSLYSFLVVVVYRGFIRVATMKVGVAMRVGFGRCLLKVLVGRTVEGRIGGRIGGWEKCQKKKKKKKKKKPSGGRGQNKVPKKKLRSGLREGKENSQPWMAQG
jgi:hypothetical protein